MMCLPHSYLILSYNLLRKSVVSFSSVMNYGNTKSLTKSLEILCKQYYCVIADVILSCWKQFFKLLRSEVTILANAWKIACVRVCDK